MKSNDLQLNDVIESSVDQIVVASHAAVVAAVDRAFGRTSAPVRRAPTTRTRGGSYAPRRTTDEIAELAQRFLEATREVPGETMAVLAPRLGISSTKLQVPVARLKRSGQIKTAGQHQFKRYFPVEDAESEAATDRPT